MPLVSGVCSGVHSVGLPRHVFDWVLEDRSRSLWGAMVQSLTVYTNLGIGRFAAYESIIITRNEWILPNEFQDFGIERIRSYGFCVERVRGVVCIRSSIMESFAGCTWSENLWAEVASLWYEFQDVLFSGTSRLQGKQGLSLGIKKMLS